MPRSYVKRGSSVLARRAYEQSQKGRECHRRYQQKKNQMLKNFRNRLKMKPCADCGIQYNPWVMQFDHRDPMKKKHEIGSVVSWQALKEEIVKCDVVCANCHAERTYQNQHWSVRRDDTQSGKIPTSGMNQLCFFDEPQTNTQGGSAVSW